MGMTVLCRMAWMAITKNRFNSVVAKGEPAAMPLLVFFGVASQVVLPDYASFRGIGV